MSNIYKGVDLSNALAHYGRKGMRRGRHLAGTTWWQKSGFKKSSVKGALDTEVKDKQRKIERDKQRERQERFEKGIGEKGRYHSAPKKLDSNSLGIRERRWEQIKDDVERQRDEERIKKFKKVLEGTFDESSVKGALDTDVKDMQRKVERDKQRERQERFEKGIEEKGRYHSTPKKLDSNSLGIRERRWEQIKDDVKRQRDEERIKKFKKKIESGLWKKV